MSLRKSFLIVAALALAGAVHCASQADELAVSAGPCFASSDRLYVYLESAQFERAAADLKSRYDVAATGRFTGFVALHVPPTRSIASLESELRAYPGVQRVERPAPLCLN